MIPRTPANRRPIGATSRPPETGDHSRPAPIPSAGGSGGGPVSEELQHHRLDPTEAVAAAGVPPGGVEVAGTERGGHDRVHVAAAAHRPGVADPSEPRATRTLAAGSSPEPFDRLLVSQALLEDLPILSANPQLTRYAVEVVW